MTAVEYLVEQIKNNVHNTIEEFELLVKQAKQMEKQQIVDAWNSAYGGDSNYTGYEYYNETFKSE